MKNKKRFVHCLLIAIILKQYVIAQSIVLEQSFIVPEQCHIVFVTIVYCLKQSYFVLEQLPIL